MGASEDDQRTLQSASAALGGQAKAPGIPRLLVIPPHDPSHAADAQDLELARSLVTDLTLTLCRSHFYEVVAPFTAAQITLGTEGRDAVPADYVVRTELVMCHKPLPYSVLTIEVQAGVAGETIYSSEVELRSGTLLSLHYSLCAVLVDQICGQIGTREILKYRRTGAASAYVHYLLAMKRSERSDLTSLLRAQKSLTRSVQLSPDFVPALSQLARTKTLEWLERGSEDRSLLSEAMHLAQRANRYDPTDSGSLREIGHSALYLHNLGDALAHYEAAEALAPNHADLLADQADVLTHLSRHEDAEAKISRALSLNPLAPDDYYWIGGAVSFFRGRYREALGRLTAMRSPGLALRLMAACAIMDNNVETATFYRERALERDPSFTVDKWASLYPEPNSADTAHYLDALRLAGFATRS